MVLLDILAFSQHSRLGWRIRLGLWEKGRALSLTCETIDHLDRLPWDTVELFSRWNFVVFDNINRDSQHVFPAHDSSVCHPIIQHENRCGVMC